MTTPAGNTPYAVITKGLRHAGKLSEGQIPSSERLANGLGTLTDIILYEQTQGLKLWLNVDTEVPLVANQGTYTLGPGGDVQLTNKPLRVLDGYYLNADPYPVRRPLTPLSWEEWIALGQVSQSGSVNSYFVDKKQSLLTVKLWLIPDATAATGTVHLLLQLAVDKIINLTEEVNFPDEWSMFLQWAFADEVCTGQPESIMTRCEKRAEMYRKALEDFDVEDAETRFSPDTRTYVQGSSFR